MIFLMLIPVVFGIVVFAGIGITLLEGVARVASHSMDEEERRIEQESIPEWKRNMQASGQEARQQQAWDKLIERLR